MKKFAHILTVLIVLFCVSITEGAQYTVHEVTSSERTDDFRESEEFRISTGTTRVSKATFAVSFQSLFSVKSEKAPATSPRVISLSQFLYLRLRVLRN